MIEINIFIIHGLYLELRCFDPLEAGYCLAAFSFSLPPVLIFEDDACFPAASGVWSSPRRFPEESLIYAFGGHIVSAGWRTYPCQPVRR